MARYDRKCKNKDCGYVEAFMSGVAIDEHTICGVCSKCGAPMEKIYTSTLGMIKGFGHTYIDQDKKDFGR